MIYRQEQIHWPRTQVLEFMRRIHAHTSCIVNLSEPDKSLRDIYRSIPPDVLLCMDADYSVKTCARSVDNMIACLVPMGMHQSQLVLL